MKNTKYKGNLILLFTAFIWGMAFAFQSQAGEVMGSFTFGASRMTCAAFAVGLVSLLLDKKAGSKPSAETKKATVKGGIVCGIFMGFGCTLQQFGINYTSAGKAGFITALYILIVPIITAFVLRERISARTWIAVAIAVVGMYLLCMTPGEGFALQRGDIYVILCALGFSLQIIFADFFLEKADPIKMSAIEFVVVGTCSWILAFIFEDIDPASFKAALIPILYCGFISGGAGYTLQLVGQKYTDPSSASLCMSFESVFSVVGGVVILHEIMSGRELLGCVIMFAAIVLVQLPEKNKKITKGN